MIETVHACPPEGHGLTPCCGKTPFELPRTDRMTTSQCDVTCRMSAVGDLLPEAEVVIEITGPTRAVLNEVYAARARQDAKWGVQDHPDGTGNLSQQDHAEFARKWCDDAFGSGYGTWSDVLAKEVAEVNAERAPARLRAELLQVAAVAVAWAEAIDRRPL